MIILGIDIGKKSDPSALVQVEGEPGIPKRTVKRSGNLPLGMSYTKQPDAIVEVSRSADPDMFVIEGNGVGEAVADGLREKIGRKLWVLINTGGKKVRIDHESQVIRIPKTVMIKHVNTLLDHNELVFEKISEEMANQFRKFEQKPNGKLEARLGEHDDLLMALCMALMGFKIRELVG